MNYEYTDSLGVAYFRCECGVTAPELTFENNRCPDCK